jgi:hypothetical protein
MSAASSYWAVVKRQVKSELRTAPAMADRYKVLKVYFSMQLNRPSKMEVVAEEGVIALSRRSAEQASDARMKLHVLVLSKLKHSRRG